MLFYANHLVRKSGVRQNWKRFLKYLAVNLHVLATIKNQAKVEIVLFHKRVFGVDLRWLGGLVKANTPQHSLVVMPALPQRPLSLR